MDLIICFIDDSDFEHDLVRNEIAPSAPGLNFVQAYTFEEAGKMLGARIPALFLLDLWGQDVAVESPSLTPKEELENKVSQFKSLETVYEGLQNFSGDKINEFLKRLFIIVDSWRSLFEEVCDRVGQNRKYGLGNLGKARKSYPGASAVFYTSKSLISDAGAMSRAGADGLLIKPTGRDDSETRTLTREYAPKLIEDLAQIIDRNMDQLKRHENCYPKKMAEKRTQVESLISSWKAFRNK